jgi:hypothetical protein
MIKTFLTAKSLKTTLPMLPHEKLTAATSAMSATLKQPKTLTKNKSTANIKAPRNIRGGFRSLFSKGDNSPQSLKAVFLCLSVFNWCIFAPITFIMVVLFGRPLWSVSPLRDTANPINAATNYFAVLRDGLTILSKGITA